MFRGKNYKESAKLIDKQALYDPMEAFGLVIKASKAKFDETVELHVKLGRRVKIVSGKRKGRFELEFYGEDDLQRLYDALLSLRQTEENNV